MTLEPFESLPAVLSMWVVISSSSFCSTMPTISPHDPFAMSRSVWMLKVIITCIPTSNVVSSGSSYLLLTSIPFTPRLLNESSLKRQPVRTERNCVLSPMITLHLEWHKHQLAYWHPFKGTSFWNTSVLFLRNLYHLFMMSNSLALIPWTHAYKEDLLAFSTISAYAMTMLCWTVSTLACWKFVLPNYLPDLTEFKWSTFVQTDTLHVRTR